MLTTIGTNMVVEREDGGRDVSPSVKKLAGDVPSKIENEVAQIRSLFRFLGYFGWPHCRRFVPPLKIHGDAPGQQINKTESKSVLLRW